MRDVADYRRAVTGLGPESSRKGIGYGDVHGLRSCAPTVPRRNRYRNELDRVVEVAGIIEGCPAGDRVTDQLAEARQRRRAVTGQRRDGRRSRR